MGEQSQKVLLPLLFRKLKLRYLTELLTSMPIWSIIFTFICNIGMTAICSADWMLKSVVSEWEYQGAYFWQHKKKSSETYKSKSIFGLVELADTTLQGKACATPVMQQLRKRMSSTRSS